MIPLVEKLSPVQQDAMKEVFNIGSGQAATTLSEMLGQKVMVSVPSIGVSPVDEVLGSLAKPTQPVVCLVNIFAGDISGCTVWLMPGEKAKDFAQLCWHHMPQAKRSPDFNFGQIHREISAVLTEAYINAMADMLNLMTVPSTPLLLSGVLQSVLGKILVEQSRGTTLVAYVQNRFKFGEPPPQHSGFFMMLPDNDSLIKILGILKVGDAG